MSAAAALESAYLISTSTTASSSPIHLSEQQLVDCVTGADFPTTAGCDGGNSDDALKYAQRYNLTTSERGGDGFACRVRTAALLAPTLGYWVGQPRVRGGLPCDMAPRPCRVRVHARL